MLYHKNLTKESWGQKSFALQMANIGSEISRMINWCQRGNTDYYDNAFFRGLELLDLTSELAPNHRKKELYRLRENWCQLWIDADVDELRQLLRYFDHFAYICRT